ncbi:MAG: SPOR domain-containing protein [Magnetococcales bacterium]|nr:SPOR domain-containing protein [Magnetococcales bacterium]
MSTSFQPLDKIDSTDFNRLDSTNLDWSSIQYGSEKSAFWWRVFIWALTLVAIIGMAAALFWWQIDRGVGPSSTLSTVKVVRAAPVETLAVATYPTIKSDSGSSSFPQSQRDGRYIVLAGSFINEKNATRIFNQLIRAGVPAWSKQAMVNGQLHTHLLIGPYKQQDSAERAVTLIRKQTGLPVDYTTLEPEGQMREGGVNTLSGVGKSAHKEVLHPDQFVVLAGSFTTRRAARRVQNRLKLKEITASIKEFHEQDRTFFHVVIGPYRIANQANQMVETIRQKTGILAETSQIL